MEKPVSRERARQLRKKAAGKCIVASCHRKATNGERCKDCAALNSSRNLTNYYRRLANAKAK